MTYLKFNLSLTDKDVKNALKANVRRRLDRPKPKRNISPP
jgi:hypothetical protein